MPEETASFSPPFVSGLNTTGGGTWQVEVTLPVPGRCAVRIDVLIDDFTQERIEGEVDLRP